MSTTPSENFEVPQLLKTHGDLFSKHFSSELDEQAAVLKAHLLIEGVIRDFCYQSNQFDIPITCADCDSLSSK